MPCHCIQHEKQCNRPTSDNVCDICRQDCGPWIICQNPKCAKILAPGVAFAGEIHVCNKGCGVEVLIVRKVIVIETYGDLLTLKKN